MLQSPTPVERTPAQQPVQEEIEESVDNEVNPEEEERALCSHIISIKKEKLVTYHINLRLSSIEIISLN